MVFLQKELLTQPSHYVWLAKHPVQNGILYAQHDERPTWKKFTTQLVQTVGAAQVAQLGILSEHALQAKTEFTAYPDLHNRQTDAVEHLSQFVISTEQRAHFANAFTA